MRVGWPGSPSGGCPAPAPRAAHGHCEMLEVSMTRGYKIVGVVVGMALVAAVALGALLFTQPAAAAAVSAAVGAAAGRSAANYGGGLGCGQAGFDSGAQTPDHTH